MKLHVITIYFIILRGPTFILWTVYNLCTSSLGDRHASTLLPSPLDSWYVISLIYYVHQIIHTKLKKVKKLKLQVSFYGRPYSANITINEATSDLSLTITG